MKQSIPRTHHRRIIMPNDIAIALCNDGDFIRSVGIIDHAKGLSFFYGFA
jgi:hypothetical protein